jgi:membrane-bound inhibitor of C-type lysozyme
MRLIDIVTAATLFVGTALGTLGFAPASAASISVRYACPASDDLLVQRTASTAHVRLAGQTYELQRERSSIGAKYLSSNAALIIDGDSATFVAADHLELGTCDKAVPVASALSG